MSLLGVNQQALHCSIVLSSYIVFADSDISPKDRPRRLQNRHSFKIIRIAIGCGLQIWDLHGGNIGILDLIKELKDLAKLLLSHQPVGQTTQTQNVCAAHTLKEDIFF